ncbi:MAG: hypothetical protein WC464_01785 [Bdellovibrionales bacterium]
MKKPAALACLSFTLMFLGASAPLAQDSSFLNVVKTTINSESENAEVCLEFDKALAENSQKRLSDALRLEADSKSVTPANVTATNSSLCFFPLKRGADYRLVLKGLRGADGEKMDAPYTSSFTIPDRTPSLAFTGNNGSAGAFGVYDRPLTLRVVNVDRVTLDVFRVTDVSLMARAWQDRALTALAPAESAYMARDKGVTIWREEQPLELETNKTFEHKISLREKMPDLPPGLYLIVAEGKKSDASKALAPKAAAWFTKSNFSLRAVRDSENIHVIASGFDKPKGDIQLMAFSKNGEAQADERTDANGIGLISFSSKPSDDNDISGVVGTDKDGNVAFSGIETLLSPSGNSFSGIIDVKPLFAVPFDSVDVLLSLTKGKKELLSKSASFLRLSQDDFVYASHTVPAIPDGFTTFSFSAPPMQGNWSLIWQTANGDVLAKTSLHVTTDPDAPRLEAASEKNFLVSDRTCVLTIKSLSTANKSVPLIRGRVLASWQKFGSDVAGWNGYRFGTPVEISDKPESVADFLTGPDGIASLTIVLPPSPQAPGLYQAVLKIVGEPDAGVADAAPLVLPLRPQGVVVGLKPLAENARFHQNDIARFALIGLSSDGKPRDVSGLSYQIYEEGRSFAWYQDEGRWNYKPEAQLRPIGSGALSIKADASSVLEWHASAGNYRLEILDTNGNVLAQTAFSAGWDLKDAPFPAVAPLSVALPKMPLKGRDIVARFNLPESSMLTAIISDTRVRKIIHEFRPKGKNTVSFSPTADWNKTINLIIEATPEKTEKSGAFVRRAALTLSLEADEPALAKPPAAKTSLVSAEDPSAFILRRNKPLSLTFGIENNGASTETYKYSFSTSSGLTIENYREGSVTLGSKQSLSLPLFLFGETVGAKELRMEVKGAHSPRLIRNWPMKVLPRSAFLKSGKTLSVPSKQNLLTSQTKLQGSSIVLVSRRPMDGLAELLTYVFNAHPFTTEELAVCLNVLRLWRDTIDHIGIAPDFMTSAREKAYLAQLIRHQNPDGGFAPFRGKESSLNDTSAALRALGPSALKEAAPAKERAIVWIKQQLSNSWIDEKERTPRAAAYAALAAADAVDPASLHYFSDTCATSSLPAVAEANIAAAFKRIKEPDAAAFWIKKMLDENDGEKTIPLLNALASTDALSSDDVLAAMAETGAAMRVGNVPEIKDAAALLRAVAVNNALSGKGRIANKEGSRPVTGVLALRTEDSAAYINDDDEPLYATPVTESEISFVSRARGASLTRKVFRLDGVELPPESQPARGEFHLVAIQGDLSSGTKGAPILVQDGGNGLRPNGCPLSDKLDTQPIVPWLSLSDMTPVATCEISPFGIDMVFSPPDSYPFSFSAVFFARIDAQAMTDIPLPKLRILK